MLEKTEIAYNFYLLLKQNPESMAKFIKGDDDPYIIHLSETIKDYFALTSFEIQDAPIDFQNFIKDNGFLISSISEYGITECYQAFEFHLERSKTHIRVSEVAFEYLEAIAENSDTLEEELGFEKGELEWDTFIKNLDISREEILYEQALVNLVILFESYTSCLLKWLYKNDPSSRDKLRVSLTYGEILKNYNNLLEFILNQHLNIFNWSIRNKELNSNLEFNWKKLKGSEIIDEAISRRNLIIHNKGRIDEIYHKKYPTAGKINYLLTTDSKYYYRVQDVVVSIVKKIDQKVKEKNSKTK